MSVWSDFQSDISELERNRRALRAVNRKPVKIRWWQGLVLLLSSLAVLAYIVGWGQ